MRVRALAPGVLRHPPVGDRDLLGADRIRDPAHLAGIVAQPVVDVFELDDLVVGSPLASFAVTLSNTAERGTAGSDGVRSGRIDVDRQPPSTRNRLILVACILGSVIVFVDSTRRQRRAARDPARPGRRPRAAAVGGRRLPAHARLADPRRRLARRPVRCAATLPDRDRQLRRDVDPLRRCAGRNTLIVARGLQGVAGALLTPAGLAVITSTFKGEERGAAIGIVDGVDGHRVRDRPARRRLARHACVVALGVHHQRAVRARHRGSGRLRRAEDRPRGQARRGSTSVGGVALRRRPRRPGLRADRGAAARLRRPADPRDARRRDRRASPRSSSGSGARTSRCCRCGCSAAATSPSRTSRRWRSTPGSRR